MKAKITKLFRRIFGSKLELIFSKDYERIYDFLDFVPCTKEIVIAYSYRGMNERSPALVLAFLDQESGEKVFSVIDIGRYGNVGNFCFSLSGEQVMFVRDGYYLKIIDKEKGEVFCENFGKAISSLCFSPSEKEIMFVEYYFGKRDGKLIILDRGTKEEIFSMTFEASDCSPSFSPSGREIMLPKGNHNLTVLDRETMEVIFSKNFEEWIGLLSFSPSGERIMLSKYQRVLTVLDSKTGKEIFSKEFKERIFSLSFSPSGKRIMLKEGSNKLRILNSDTGKEILSKNIEGVNNSIFGMSDKVIIIRKSRDVVESYKIKI
ncbi:MAG: WD40 repeat domain-containing protein [Candidatus Pacebacteria bacterium]|nr:WD40 repeat domain-containing protein [Candidatus Paceibacterota bacterium]